MKETLPYKLPKDIASEAGGGGRCPQVAGALAGEEVPTAGLACERPVLMQMRAPVSQFGPKSTVLIG